MDREKAEMIEASVNAFLENHHDLRNWAKGAFEFVADHPQLNHGHLPVIHSGKFRMKDPDHLREKLNRKWASLGPVTPDNLFHKVTDLAGGRILHLYRDQFPSINDIINKRVASGDWVFHEDPKAITWDREAEVYFNQCGLKTEYRESHYTSVHYVIRPRADSPWSCEIQVRTLFEEIWGEIDHALNYPDKTDVKVCADQLLVLAKLVGAGSRLADSIFSSNAAPRV